ncbi:hypothetical protein BJV38_004199 [Clostridium beijerinckii]|uniref:STAS-like domain-containing protein n=1 Tax=Clostridium beijerinckii TaxID=1520 RepID=UPI00156E364C|nr:STAS-like domain-containing protein [Clostridium beijerinckii]NRT33218.1 hypothetical protein [Clostridium beijerinckii]NRT47356.1 hypothetical protein [Clostridium beijerinckii]NRZ18639.1 hypothetical protein [Clostridium beijerinckii]
MEIMISDILQSDSAVSVNQGDVVYKQLFSEINLIKSQNTKEDIIIHFDNITDLTTAFLNNSIAKLFLNFDQEYLLSHLKFQGFTNKTHINLLKLSLSNAIIFTQSKEVN